ncbi:MAG: cytochrome c maturation protein CcmE [Proteobacteria bacterium]|nr:cytochrome c maturation protein CcmE [Pseudomonadota bacterium]
MDPYVTYGFRSTLTTAIAAGFIGGAGHLFLFSVRKVRAPGGTTRGVIAMIGATLIALATVIVFALLAPADGGLDRARYVMVEQLDLDRALGEPLQVHGFVAEPVERANVNQQLTTRFILESHGKRLAVRSDGPMPDKFQVGAELVATGRLVRVGTTVLLIATDLAAKCPSTYNTVDGPRPAAQFR